MTGEVSNSPRIKRFKFTSEKCVITIMQPAAGPQRSANLQHIEQHPIPTIEAGTPEIKEEHEENTLLSKSDHRTFQQELPLRSLSGEATADYTPPAPGLGEWNTPNIYTTELPFLDGDEDEDEDEEIPIFQVASSAAEEENGPVQVNADLEDDGFIVVISSANHQDDEYVVAESPVHHQDPSPSPSPNSPLIGSPAREHGIPLEPIIYESEESADNFDSGDDGEYVNISQKRGRSQNASPETEEGEDQEDMSDEDIRETPNAKRIRTLSPSTERLLSGRHIQHTWSMEQREAVYLLRRFTANAPEKITTILNQHFSQEDTPPLNLRIEQVNAQWAEWSRAFWAESKYDEEERWKEIRASFAATARLCGLQLRLAACKNKPSVQTKGNRHQVHKTDIRKWLLQSREPKSAMRAEPLTPAVNVNMTPSSPLQGRSTYDDNNGLLDFFQNAESQYAAPNQQESSSRNNPVEYHIHTPTGQELQTNSPQSNVSLLSPTNQIDIVKSRYFPENKDRSPRPRLLFRVYHSGMPGQNSPNGFRSGRHSQLSREGVPAPPAEKDRLLDEAQIHLQRRLFSSFIAFTTSLVWTLYKALDLENKSVGDSRIGHPRIALVDTERLPDASYVYHAGSLISDITRDKDEPTRVKEWNDFEGHAYRARYEYIIWGEVPADAIIFNVPLSELTTATSAPPSGGIAIADFVSLPHLRKHAHIPSSLNIARKAFLSTGTDRVGYDVSSDVDGVALGRLARMFGFSISSSPELLTAFVYSVAQGWGMMTDGCDAVTEVTSGVLEELEQASDDGGVDDYVAEIVFRAVKVGLERANDEIGKERKRFKWKTFPRRGRKT